MVRCPWCLTDSLRPHPLSCGRGWLECTHCRAVVHPPMGGLRKECMTCGRKRCPWSKCPPAHCERWMVKRSVARANEQLLLFEEE